MLDTLFSLFSWILSRWWIFLIAGLIGLGGTQRIKDEAKSRVYGGVFDSLFGDHQRGLVDRLFDAVDGGMNAHAAAKQEAIRKVVLLWVVLIGIAIAVGMAVG